MKQSILRLFTCLILGVVFCTTAWAADVTVDAKEGNITQYNGQTVNITIKNRTYQANNWVVVCYPFEVTKAMLDANFPSGYAVEEYSSMSADGKYTFTVLDLSSKSIPAGTPFLLKSKEEVSSVTFNNVKINTTLNNITKTNGSYSGTLNGTYSKPAMWQFNSGQSLAGGLFISASGTLTGPYSSPLNDDTDILRITNGYFSFSTGVSTTLSIESGTGGTGGTVIPPSAGTLEEKIAAKAQLTDVPTLYITVPDAEGKAINTVLDEEKEYHTATIQLVDKTEGGLTEFTDQVMIKVRGNSTAKENKKPYRLKFAKEIKDANGTVIANCQKHDMLGKGYSKRNWALLANYLDPAMVRNALTNKIGELVGMPFCPGYKFADVVINGEYRGTYQITDHVEADADRVNVDENTGWFLESARGDMVEAPSASAQSLMMSIKNPDTDKWTTEQIATLKKQIEDWFKPVDDLFCIYNGTFDLESFTDPVNGWRKYWDEESLVDFYIGINLTGDYDGFMTVKMYRDLNKKLKFGPLWDKDLAFGNYSADKGITLAEDQQIGSYFTSYAKKLWLDPVFIKKVHDKLNTLVSNGIVTTLKNNVDELAELTAQTEELNRPLWGIGASWSQSFSTREAAVKQLKDYLDQHIPWFQSTINTQYTKLGGDNIVDNSIPGDDFNDGTTPGDGGGSGNVEIPETSTFEKLNVTDTGYKIPAGAFNAKATSIEVTFTRSNGTATNVWGFYGYEGSEWDANGIPGSNWNTYKINITNAEDIAAVAKNGIAWRLQNDGGTTGDVTIVVHNIGVPEGGDDDDTNPTDDPFNEQGTRKQLTDLPTIYLNAETINGEWLQAAVEVFDKDNKLYQGATWKKEGLSKKGNINVYVQYQGSGADNSKNSYRLKFNDKINLLSATGSYKQWVLLANDDDPTMLNNALAKELGDAIGMPWTPDYQFVDLYVNDKYMGTYQLTDRVKAEEGRSLVTGGNKDADWQVRFNDNAELEEDGTTDFVKTSGVNVIYRNPDPKDITPEALETLKSDLSTYFNNFFADSATNTYGNISDNVDKQQLINWYIAQEILGVYKGFSSIEAYRSVTEGAADNLLHFGPLWDSEKGFGNTGLAPAINMSDLNTTGSHNGLMIEYSAFEKMNKIFQYLWTQDWFKSGVKTKWDAIKTTLPTSLSQTITTVSGTIAESQALNAQKWNSSLGNYDSYEDALDATNAYITKRFAYLDKKFTELAGAAHVHSYTAYIDNGDGTHSRKCPTDNEVEEGSELHTLKTNSDLKAHCEVCGYTSTDAIVNAQADENVYVIKEYGQNNTSYITATSDFTPKANTFYETTTALPDDVKKDNVIWKRADGDYVANSVVITDGTAYNFDAKIHAKEAVYSRTTGTSMWGTMCIPFKIAQSTDDYDIYQLDALTINKAQGTATLSFSPATKTSGELPLVYKRKESATGLTFNGVPQEYDGTNAEDVGYVTVKKSKKIADLMNPSGEWTLYGNVRAKTTISVVDEASAYYKKQVYYFSGDKFMHCTGTVNVAPFRAFYVSTQDLSGIQNVKSFGIGISDDEEATDINDVNIEDVLAIFIEQGGVTLNAAKATNINIHGMNGTKISGLSLKDGETRHISLAPGIYVINNKKIIIR